MNSGTLYIPCAGQTTLFQALREWASVGILAIMLALPGISRAQVHAGIPMTGPQPQTESEQTGTQSGQPKNVLKLEELTQLDVKFHKEMDTAQVAYNAEKFGEAQDAFSQLAGEIQATIKRISAGTFPKNSFLEIDGVRKPATVEAEVEWFTRTLNKAQQKKNRAGILQKVTDMQSQGADLLIAGKYPEDRDAYQKSAMLLAENRSQFDDSEYRFFLERSENGQELSVTTFWAKQFGAFRDRYNRTTEDAKMSPEEIHRTIQSVADDIVRDGYADSSKHPDMPDDVRTRFHNLLDVANQYLRSQ